jgi:hypothetical protein
VEDFFDKHPVDVMSKIDGLSMMKNMVRLILKTHELSPELHREINVLCVTDPDFAEMDRREKRESHQKISELLLPAMKKMRVTDMEAATLVVSQTMEAVIHGIVMSQPEIAQERLLDALAEMLTRYLFK